MASVHERKNKADEVTSHQVKWRLGGSRTGGWQTEIFDPDETGKKAAEVFRDAVNAAGQQLRAGFRDRLLGRTRPV
ncbi:MAG: hypothetical protein JF597_47050 [Streptomyces sp.]|uniref:hypothetical protein n=1 Tax=Streptomyces sp. TaxID=1931 RepID=UPI0025CD704B|nr:hypothetical protein [Streptomyces sp.]MBW8800851.1 hypothetical protein [Streptomyces sp.]